MDVDDLNSNIIEEEVIQHESNPIVDNHELSPQREVIEEVIQESESNINGDNHELSPQREGTKSIANDKGKEVTKKLCEGMTFDSWKSIDSYYAEYDKERGFGIRIRTSRKDDKTGELIRCYWVGCKARLSANYKPEIKKWEIGLFHDEHNHILVSPTSVKYIRREKKLSSAAKNLVDIFYEHGVPMSLPAYMLGCGEDEISRRACWNHRRNVRLKDLVVGDAQAVLDFCIRKQAENPNFFYSIDYVDGRLVNIFWIDARSRLSYEYFGDVVTFDTTYRTNKYSMPFAPFVGVNHHGQSIFFGFSLLQDEQEPSFIWLFQTWLQAMHGKAPIGIITDQDHAMGNAIRKVFPNTCHRLCLWHITNKFKERIPNKIYNEDFKLKLKNCLHNSYNTDEFDKSWDELMETNGLKDNE